MFYIIDGYNLIFYFSEPKGSLLQLRTKLIVYLQKAFRSYNLQGMVVFDGDQIEESGGGREYANPLEIAYAPKGKSADEYILEKIEGIKIRPLITVVTNDRSLISQSRSLGARTETIDHFMTFLQSRKAKRKDKSIEIKESPSNFERLLKIFEDRLNRDGEDI